MSTVKTAKLHFDNGKICTTFDDYDALIQKIDNMKFQRGNWWPSDYEIEHYIEPNFDLCYEFIVWMLETGPDPENDDENNAKKKLNDLLINKVEFVDEYQPEEAEL